MRRFNLNAAEVAYDDDDPTGYSAGYVRVAPHVGGKMLGATIYELAAGQEQLPIPL